jgi:hypothetical protein
MLRNLLTIQAPVEYLLQEVAQQSEVKISDIPPALSRLCDAWVAIAPNGSVLERMPISHVVGRLVDLWVSHRDANLREEERRAIPSNKSIREGFVKNDITAKALFDSISRLSAPAMLAGAALAERKVERLGTPAQMGQDAFKVFFDTLFAFEPAKADARKDTASQFIPYLWSRLESRWRDSTKLRCEDKAIRSIKGRDGEVSEMASQIEDKRARDSAFSVDQHDEFQWVRTTLIQARDEGVIRAGDYRAIVECYQLDDDTKENAEHRAPSAQTKMRALRGIERFKIYLRERESEDIGKGTSVPNSEHTHGDLRTLGLSDNSLRPALWKRAEERSRQLR